MQSYFFISALTLTGLSLLALTTSEHSEHEDIDFSYLTTLIVAGGPDKMQLNNASVHITFTIPAHSKYVDRSGRPAVLVHKAQITISGSKRPDNNGTFSLGSVAFYPTFAGFFKEPGGVGIPFLLPGGHTLTVQGKTNPTTAGLEVRIGDKVHHHQFGPTTSAPGILYADKTDGTGYNLIGTVVTASKSTTTAVA